MTQAIVKSGGKAIAAGADVSEAADATRLFDEAGTLSSVEMFVQENDAGVIGMRPHAHLVAQLHHHLAPGRIERVPARQTGAVGGEVLGKVHPVGRYDIGQFDIVCVGLRVSERVAVPQCLHVADVVGDVSQVFAVRCAQ